MTPYLELMKKALTGLLYDENLWLPEPWEEDHEIYGVRNSYMMLLKDRDFSPGSKAEWRRKNGKDWPLFAQTMVGLHRLNHLQWCVDRVLAERIPGDFIECGVWRGGSSIFMKACLNAWSDNTRLIWMADSYQGMPQDDEALPGLERGRLAVSVHDVIDNFNRYDLADNRLRFVEGWFNETLPTIDEPMALVRIDADLYGSTMHALTYLYDQVSPGGFVIVDDYGAVPGCAKAVDKFIEANKLEVELQRIDWTGVYWRKPKEATDASFTGNRFTASPGPNSIIVNLSEPESTEV